jgi:hypothetical protein
MKCQDSLRISRVFPLLPQPLDGSLHPGALCFFSFGFHDPFNILGFAEMLLAIPRI